MYRYLLLFILIGIFGCQDNERKFKKIAIDLKPSTEINFYDNPKSQFLLLSMSQINPDFYNKNLENFKGIPELDSFEILTENVNNSMFYRSALFAKDDNKEYLRDSLSMNVNNSKSFINVLSGFKRNEQILILDSNNNNDFSDDNILTFPISYRFFENNNPEINDSSLKIDSLSTLELNYILQNNNEEVAVSRNVQLFPISNYYYTQLMGENNLKEYAAIIRFKDGLKGNLEVNNQKFQTYLQGLNSESNSILIIPEKYKLLKDAQVFQQNFLYSLNDTIQVVDEFYTIKYDIAQSSLELTRLDTISYKYGSRIGNRIKNFSIETLGSKFHRIDSIFTHNKEYLLLDFWGTWCKPCIELTPELVAISKKYSPKLEILSIASDDSLEVVKSYINDNNMNWYHSITPRNGQNEILNELNINSYPTFLLLNRNREIIYRGGTNSLEVIENFMSDDQ